MNKEKNMREKCNSISYSLMQKKKKKKNQSINNYNYEKKLANDYIKKLHIRLY